MAILGCGKIADEHASQIQRIKGCEIVAVCDKEPLMAQQLYERFPIRRYFTDVSDLLDQAHPDVIHITTPPQSHFDLARMCLERGCHVYVEKPFTLHAVEAEALAALAREKGLKLTAGHDEQFSHVARRLRALVNSGYLGGRPVHMESYYCYDLADPDYARALLSDQQHWVRSLPGKLLHNLISHGVARIVEFFDCEAPQVIAHGFVSPLLHSIGERDLVDELRVIIADARTTAYFTFSSQMRPCLHLFRMYGPKNGVVLDQDQQTLIKLRGSRFKSYAEKFVPPVQFARQYLGNLTVNIRKFLANDFHMKAGMKCLIESFYRSISENTEPPIPYREIILTARIMDSIFQQLDAQAEHIPAPSLLTGSWPSVECTPDGSEPALVKEK
ncbi:MAG TPA: Gfo/Idh/MocA family oxidoreductase [Candidatus Angelobacter sp.]|nr:Gfo/Idh/MocA family oxidoreductase [Candidatus Angelobacter sp.]